MRAHCIAPCATGFPQRLCRLSCSRVFWCSWECIWLLVVPHCSLSTKCQQGRGMGPLYHQTKILYAHRIIPYIYRIIRIIPYNTFIGYSCMVPVLKCEVFMKQDRGRRNGEEGIRSLPNPCLSCLMFQGIWVLPCPLPLKGGLQHSQYPHIFLPLD